jgi:hypothetical protein
MMLKGDYDMSKSGWGCSIQWVSPEKFQRDSPPGTLFKVVGWQPRIPKKGQTLVAEFKKSWIKFVFMNVERCSDPPDMFFADVGCIEQKMKQ